MSLVRGAALVLALIYVPATWAAEKNPILEEHIKAAFLYKFAAYVEWPSPAPVNLPFTIGIIGARSEERRVGKECRSRWSRLREKTNWLIDMNSHSCFLR